MARQKNSETIQDIVDSNPMVFPGHDDIRKVEALNLMEQYDVITSTMLRDVLDFKDTRSAQRILEKLRQKLPEHIGRVKKDGKQYVYGFNKNLDDFEPVLSSALPAETLSDSLVTSNLYLGELGFATKAYDPRMMRGLAFYLKTNDYSEQISNVMMLGGLMPKIPPFYGVASAEDMRFLGQRSDSDEDDEISTRIQEEKLGIDDKRYFDKYVKGKIRNKQDAAATTRVELEVLLNAVPHAEIHYHHGEEDAENMRYDRELMITELAESKQSVEKNEEERSKLQQKIKTIKRGMDVLEEKTKLFAYVVNQRLGRLQTEKTGQELNDYLNTIASDIDAMHEKYSPEVSEEVTSFLRQKHRKSITQEQIVTHYEKVRLAEIDKKQKISDIESEMDECQRQIDAAKRTSENWGAFRFTKRVEISPEEEEIIFRVAKKRYNHLLYDMFGDEAERINIHTSRFRQVKGAEIKGENEESPMVVKDGNLVYLLTHNPNALNSNTPTKKDLRMQKEKAKLQVKRLHAGLSQQAVPDVTISSHGKGGFMWQPQTKYREAIEEGVYADAPEIVMHFKLPTFQSSERLEDLAGKGLKNIHTKRFNEGPFAAGAVLHTIKENGVQEIEYIDETTLLLIGQTLEDLNYHRLKESSDPDDKKKVDEIEIALKERFKVEFGKVEPDGDAHLGAPNRKGRPSNYQYVDAIIEYQRKNGLPEMYIVNEAVNGALFVAPTGIMVEGDTAAVVQKNIEKILNSGEGTELERLKAVNRYQKANHQANGIGHVDLQIAEWGSRMVPYITELLDNGAHVVFMSGNHYNGTSKDGRDEATVLSSIIKAARPEKEDYIHIFGAFGDKVGLGELSGVLPGERTFYATHKFPERGKNEIAGALERVRESGIIADQAMGFDRHHCGGGHGDGTTVTIGPGKQTWSNYVDQIGKLSGLRGLVNVLMAHSPELKGVTRWEIVLGEALERPEYMESLENPIHGYRKPKK
ncbi:MAG: hypothetical protein ABIF40_01855 [archaeon]